MPVQSIIEKLGTRPGQGGMLEQIDKLLRKQQRADLYVMLEAVSAKEVAKYPVALEKHIPQVGKKRPTVLRFSLPRWREYDEVFWQALGDYMVLALHRVKDVEYNKLRGKIKVEYFAKETGRIRTAENIREIIQKLAFLVETEALPTDFTRFRRMAERRSHIGEMSKEEAAVIGAALKVIFSL